MSLSHLILCVVLILASSMCLLSHLEVLFQNEYAFPRSGHEASVRLSFSTNSGPTRAIPKMRSSRGRRRSKERRKGGRERFKYKEGLNNGAKGRRGKSGKQLRWLSESTFRRFRTKGGVSGSASRRRADRNGRRDGGPPRGKHPRWVYTICPVISCSGPRVSCSPLCPLPITKINYS